MSWMTCHAQNDLLGYRRKILDFFIDFYLLKKKKKAELTLLIRALH